MIRNNLAVQSENYRRIEKAIQYLERNFKRQPSLEEIAESVNLSKYHFQRTFKSWAGVTPSQFMHYLTVEYAKGKLRESSSIFDATLDAGLSSPGRLHDLFVSFEAMTPGEYKLGGAGLQVYYGFHPTPFGLCILGATERGICALRFITEDNQESILGRLKDEWPQADFIENPSGTEPIINRLFSTLDPENQNRFHLLIKGTNFQVKVWQALLSVPFGSLVSYQDIANAISLPGASRAVGNAIATNPIAYFIPCHRVITKAGKAHNYRWGSARKKAILGWEAIKVTQPEIAIVP
jgi:AraC family transcriptional regulator of adaptative response/methylated-DNA-[protein]-cysteine methyltransferase